MYSTKKNPDGLMCCKWNLFPRLLQEWFKTPPGHGDGTDIENLGWMGAAHAWGQLARLEHPWISFKNGNPMGLGQCSNGDPAKELRGNAKDLPTLLPQPTFILAWNARNNSLLRKYGGQFIKNSFPLTLVIEVALFFLPISREGSRQPKLCWMKDKWVKKLLENL